MCLEARCTRNKANRTITREANEHLMEAMAQRMKAQPAKFKLRKTLAEPPFETIKRSFGYLQRRLHYKLHCIIDTAGKSQRLVWLKD
jgi:hypothetical protein